MITGHTQAGALPPARVRSWVLGAGLLHLERVSGDSSGAVSSLDSVVPSEPPAPSGYSSLFF